MSDNPHRLIKQCLLTGAKTLNLGNCGLTERDFTPDSSIIQDLKRCSTIEKLVLSNEYYDDFTKRRSRGENTGKPNMFSRFPETLYFLKGLTTLWINGTRDQKWRLDNIDFVKNFQKLTRLDVSFCNIDKIVIDEEYPSLSYINASSNKIKQIKGLHYLNELNDIDLSGNHLGNLSFIKAGSLIKELNLDNNKLMSIKGLELLTELRLLILSRNPLCDLMDFPLLPNLEVLYCEKNRLQTLEAFTAIISLKVLNLAENELTSIVGIGQLKALTMLLLSENKIISLKGIEALSDLEFIDISKNEISDIEPLVPFLEKEVPAENRQFQYAKAPKNSNYVLSDNPLTTPPVELAQQGSKAILHYFKELAEQGTEYLYEAKMLIVGQPRAGKTTLRKKLFDINSEMPSEEKTTRGIEIERLNLTITDQQGKQRELFYNVWDFGGQHIYQTTHQFFLTHRSLYVLVMDTGKDSIGNDDTTINYWLQVVELLGDNSPLLIIRNEKNERQINIDLAQKRSRFEFIKGDYGIDLNGLIVGAETYSREKVDAFLGLKEDLEIQLKRLPLVGFPMPRNWVIIRNKLQQLSLDHEYIPKKEFIELCQENAIVDYDKQMELSRIFHDLGIFLHFQDYGAALDDFIILQNIWATDAVFAVFDNKTIQKNKGRFTDQDLSEIWKNKNYEPSVHKKLLALMMQFELCYQVDRSRPNVYIIPEMLDDSAPVGYSWQSKRDLPLQYRYDFMPKGILTRLIVRLHKYINSHNGKQIVWKTGVNIDGTALDCPETQAEIIEAWDNKQLYIRVKGPFIKEIMSKITMLIDELNNEFFKPLEGSSKTQKSRWYKMIPCNCVGCQAREDKHFYDHNELLERKAFGKSTIECKKKPYADVNINELIDGVFSAKPNILIKTANQSTIKIFLASSSELKSEREQFELFINRENKRLHERGIFLRLDIWEDFVDVMSQTRLQDEYNKVIQGCDIFVMLFHTKVGMYTAEEFEVAFRHFKKDDSPKILTYFKKSKIDTTELNRQDANSLFDFQDKLKSLGHFFTTFENVQDLQLHFKKQLEHLFNI